MFKFYDDYLEKQEVIKRLNQIIESKMTATTTLTTAEVLRNAFVNNNIGFDDRDLELAEDIITQCQQNNYTAHKAATIICEEMDIEMRWNRGAIENALLTNEIFNK